MLEQVVNLSCACTLDERKDGKVCRSKSAVRVASVLSEKLLYTACAVMRNTSDNNGFVRFQHK